MTSPLYKTRIQTALQKASVEYIIVASFDAMQQTNDSPARFIQEANFLYLTGIEEPGWILFAHKTETILIAPNISEIHRIFDGGLSDEEAQNISGADRVVSKIEGDELIGQLIQKDTTVGLVGADPYEGHASFVLNPAPRRLYDAIGQRTEKIQDIRPVIAKMRGIKSAEEIEKIRQAVAITHQAFMQVKEVSKKATHEYTLEAAFTYTFRNAGVRHAYEPIVASGLNACTLHYQANDAALPAHGLVLMDVGARVEGYATDITRTYAIGTPSEREKAVHAAVERAHHQIIALIKPGLSVKDYHDSVDDIMKAALRELGLLQSPDDYRKYFPHAISHGLGLDVHDPLGAPKVFEPGMVLTVEPGIYIPEEGIGVRIEDDILVTEKGNENLSGILPTSL